jgi:hypothetical protein
VKVNISREFVEVVGVFSLIVISLWTEQYSAFFMAAAMVCILISTLTSPIVKTAAQLGIGSIGLRKTAWIAVSGALLAVAILGAGALEGTLHAYPWLPRPLLHSGIYAVWALVQQFIAQSFFFIRFERLLASGTRAVLATAFLFSAVHLPNWVLLVATAMMGLVFAEIFRRHRNIYWLAVAHAMLGIALAMAMPDALHHQMNVGVAYLSYPGQ